MTKLLCALLLIFGAGCANSPPDAVAPGTAPISGIPATILTIDDGAIGYESAVALVPRTTTTSTQPAAPTWSPAPRTAPWSNWRVDSSGVAYHSGNLACPLDVAFVIAEQFMNQGASIDTVHWATYVASREGNCNYLAVHIGPTDNSHCFFQLNAKGGGPLSRGGVLGLLGWTTDSVKVNPSECARAGADLWAVCGKGPWVYGDYGCRKPSS